MSQLQHIAFYIVFVGKNLLFAFGFRIPGKNKRGIPIGQLADNGIVVQIFVLRSVGARNSSFAPPASYTVMPAFASVIFRFLSEIAFKTPS